MGCFWGAEKRFWKLEGVYSTQVFFSKQGLSITFMINERVYLSGYCVYSTYGLMYLKFTLEIPVLIIFAVTELYQYSSEGDYGGLG